MKILKIESQSFHEINYKSSGPSGTIRNGSLPFFKATVDKLPTGISSIVVTSDLQGREINGTNRLLGEVVAEELSLLQELEEIPLVNIVILAGDLYDYPDCRKLGGTGDVTRVWNAFAHGFEQVVGVHGNHDTVIEEQLNKNINILDCTSETFMDLKVGGISGIIGRLDRNQRKSEQHFKNELIKLIAKKNDITILHQGPDDPENGQKGELMIRECLENKGAGLVVFGHCHWNKSLINIGNNQVLNVNNKLFLLEEVNSSNKE